MSATDGRGPLNLQSFTSHIMDPLFSQGFIFGEVMETYSRVELPRHGALWHAAEVAVRIDPFLVL